MKRLLIAGALLVSTTAHAHNVRLTSQDVYVDLDTAINWTDSGASAVFGNACDQLQAAVNPYLTTSGTTPWVVRVSGTATIMVSDLQQFRYHNGTIDTTYPMDACWIIAPASSIHESGTPIIDGRIEAGNGAVLSMVYENARLQYNMAGQTRPAILIYRGGTFFGGLNGSGSNETFLSDVIDERGSFTLASGGSPVNGSWAASRVVAMDASTGFESLTTMVGLMDDGVTRGSSEKATWRIFCSAAYDTDDIGYLMRDTWGRFKSGFRIRRCGTGVQIYSANRGSFPASYLAGNHNNVVAGDPTNGCGRVFAATCGGTTCTAELANAKQCTALSFYGGTTMEGAGSGSQFVAYGRIQDFDFNSAHFESATTISAHQILLGAGVCDTGARENLSCGTDTDCGGGGAVCTPTLPVAGVYNRIGKVSFRDMTVPSRRANETFRGMFLGKGLGTGTDTFGTIFLERLWPAESTAAAEDGKLFGYDPAIAQRIVTSAIPRSYLPRRYPNYAEHQVRWCNFTFVANASDNIVTGDANCALDEIAHPLEVNCSTNGTTAKINVERRARATPDTAGTDILTADIVCPTGLTTKTDGPDPAVASVFAAETIAADQVLTPTVTSEGLTAGQVLRVGIKYVREE